MLVKINCRHLSEIPLTLFSRIPGVKPLTIDWSSCLGRERRRQTRPSVYGMSQTGIQLSAKMLANLIQWPECDFVWGWHLHMRRHLYIRARRHLHIRAHFTCHLLKRFLSFTYLFECKMTHHTNQMHGDNKTHKLTKIKSYSAVMNYYIQKGIYNDIDCVWGRHENMGEEREKGYMKMSLVTELH